MNISPFQEFYDEIFTMLGMLSATHVSPTMWQVLPALYNLYIKSLESDDIYLEGLLIVSFFNRLVFFLLFVYSKL